MILRKQMMVNAKKPSGFLGKIKVKRMNTGDHEQLARWGFSHISLRGNERAIDLGCGGGANVRRMLEMLPKGRVGGLDYSGVSVRYSRQLNREAIAAGRCRILQGNVAQIPVRNEAVDLVTAFETIYFWPDLKLCFSEVFRILKNNGTFLITNDSDGKNAQSLEWAKIVDGLKLYTADELKKLLQEAGFCQIRIDDELDKDRLCVAAKKQLQRQAF